MPLWALRSKAAVRLSTTDTARGALLTPAADAVGEGLRGMREGGCTAAGVHHAALEGRTPAESAPHAGDAVAVRAAIARTRADAAALTKKTMVALVR